MSYQFSYFFKILSHWYKLMWFYQVLGILWFGKAKKIGRSSQRSKKQFFRSSRSGVFLKKDILKICSKFRGEHPCRSVISIKLLCNFIEIALWYGCSPVNLQLILRAPVIKNTSGRLLLYFYYQHISSLHFHEGNELNLLETWRSF